MGIKGDAVPQAALRGKEFVEDSGRTCGGRWGIHVRRWYAHYLGRPLSMNGKRRLLGSFTHGSMANALPQAIGAQVSHAGRQVISLSGDGGLAMLMGDLLTASVEVAGEVNCLQQQFVGLC